MKRTMSDLKYEDYWEVKDRSRDKDKRTIPGKTFSTSDKVFSWPPFLIRLWKLPGPEPALRWTSAKRFSVVSVSSAV